MQVLNLALLFGNDEANIANRILEIHINDNFPLEFSISNASYEISSFEQKSDAVIKIQHLYSSTNPINYKIGRAHV